MACHTVFVGNQQSPDSNAVVEQWIGPGTLDEA
jgi:hypothetical protein